MAFLLSNEQYDNIMNSYQQLRLDQESRHNSKVRDAYARIPALKDIDHKISTLAIESFKSNRNKKIDLSKEIDFLHESKISLLLQNDFPADYLDISYNCIDCKDTGYVNGNRCHCFKKKIVSMIYSDKRWQDVFSRENFDTFDLNLYSNSKKDTLPNIEMTPRQAAKDALSKAKNFVKSFNIDNLSVDNLLISGNAGIGKTFLCNCIAKELIEAGFFVVYLSSTSLFELFERVTFTNKSRDNDFSPLVKDFSFSNIYDCDLLIIDDLGTEYVNNFTTPKLFDLLNRRLSSRLPTLISTNLDVTGLSNLYSERLISRILGSFTWVHFGGEDLRLKIRFQNRRI